MMKDEIMEKYLVTFLLLLNICFKLTFANESVNLTQEINSESRSSENLSDTVGRTYGVIPKDPEFLENNEVYSKYYPDIDPQDPYADYPASYYGHGHYGGEPSKTLGFGKPGFGFHPGFFLGFWKWKIWIAAIAKILFKLLIFKKIIKFIILIFLLIFTPTIFSSFIGAGDNGLFRRFNVEKSKNERINDLAAFVMTAIDSFERSKECMKRDEEFQCRLSRMFKMIDTKYPFRKILKIYRRKLDDEERSRKISP